MVGQQPPWHSHPDCHGGCVTLQYGHKTNFFLTLYFSIMSRNHPDGSEVTLNQEIAMKRKKQDPQDLELRKSHIVISIIRAQEEADRVLRQCERLEAQEGCIAEASHCREVANYHQRKANCYMKKYELLKRRQSLEEH